MTSYVFLLGGGRGGTTLAVESLRHPVSIRAVVSLQHRYVTYGLMDLGPYRLACMWMMDVMYGYAGYATWLRQIWLRWLRHTRLRANVDFGI